MTPGFTVSEICPGLYRIVDVLDNHCYLVVGERESLLVDSAGGIGDLRACVRELTDLPVTVALTHSHYDHVGGSFWFDRLLVSPEEGDFWPTIEDHSERVHEQVIKEGVVSESEPFGPRDGARPQTSPVHDGDTFDLGGRVVRAVALPGHTKGSTGYLVEDARVLLTGDAVTPIMTLFFAESLDIPAWQATLEKMRLLPFDHFFTGHHDYAFAKDDLDSFIEAGTYAMTDRGMEWQHLRLPEFQGIVHFCPCETPDADSPLFRAVIEKWHELPPRKRKGRARRARS